MAKTLLTLKKKLGLRWTPSFANLYLPMVNFESHILLTTIKMTIKMSQVNLQIETCVGVALRHP